MSDLSRALDEVWRAQMGKFHPTLEDGWRWERLGIGRIRFVRGIPTWEPSE